MSTPSESGYIYDIQPYSVHDGPGIRTLVFFKGCPLNCLWCSNPESIYPYPQLRYFSEICKQDCSLCIEACSNNAIKKFQEKIKIDFIKCRTCNDNKCIKACKNKALQICGYKITPDDLIKKIEKDIPFFGEDGGITLSGGEPFFQPGFAFSVLKKCKEKGISTVVESCLNVPFENINRCLPYIDFFIFDIKIISEKKHLEYCNANNKQILKNIKTITKSFTIPLLTRLPLIPGYTDDEKNILNISAFLKENGLKYLNLLPYMNLGKDKYEQIGLCYKLHKLNPPSTDSIQNIIELFEKNGIFCI
ncbi:MAG TPA: glycyl-radical enzyme activating protein [Bacteroidales bacterium]|nr:glycyl-radical enzyme activating protein [Bacteroidales bacterium]HPS15769.1 glycyl-radical enzyme activating protein [Bacteroidales bacterium]